MRTRYLVKYGFCRVFSCVFIIGILKINKLFLQESLKLMFTDL